jgi:hypothetical protein
VDFTFRPIDKWPGELTRGRRSSPFRTSWGRTLDLLDRELGFLQARNVVFQVAMQESDIRLDGRPRARAVASHPGVIIAFDSRYGPLKYATDVFWHWEDNVRAIALGLEALRKVDRYGITKRGEQYTGWKQISQHAGAIFATADEAADWMVDQLAQRGIEADFQFEDAYRLLARRLHPDTPGGSHDQFVKLQQAKELIEA